MTTASAPATSSERRDPLFQNTKNRLASLSSKNEEVNKKNFTFRLRTVYMLSKVIIKKRFV